MKNTVILGIALLALVVSMLAGAGFFAAPQGYSPQRVDALDEIRMSGEITACYIPYKPFVMKNQESGELSGITIDIFESIADKSNWKINYVESTWSHIVLDLQSKKCKVNVSGIFPLIERAAGGVMFSNPFGYVGNNGVVAKNNDRFHSLEELNQPGVVVAVVEGEQGHEFAKKHLPNAELHVISSSDISLSFVEVSAGRADVALGDDITAQLYLKEHDDVKLLLDEPYWLRETTFAVNEDDIKLLNFFNNAIDVLIVSGEIQEINDRYGFDIKIPKLD